MSTRHPSRIALAVFDCFITDNDSLRGDLVEQFYDRPSQVSLWRQVFYAVAYRPWPRPFSAPGGIPFGLLGIAMLALAAFEAVFATNVIHRFLFGPSVQDIRGALYLNPLNPAFPSIPASSAQSIPIGAWLIAALAIASSLPTGWFIARVREHHRGLALAAFGISVILCCEANLQLSTLAQWLTSAAFILGLLAAGSLEATVDAQPSA